MTVSETGRTVSVTYHNEHFAESELTGELADCYTRLTDHALSRWETRAPEAGTDLADLRNAWQHSVPGDRFADKMSRYDGQTPDRVRLSRYRDPGGKTVDIVFICLDTPNPIPKDERLGMWTNVVTTYTVESIPNRRLKYDIRRYLTEQEGGGE